MSRNSITPSRAFLTIGDLVLTCGGCALRPRPQVLHLHRAGRGRLRRPADHLDEAHPAVAGDRQPLVVAEPRDLDPGLLAGLQQRQPRIDLDLDVVDDEFAQIAHGRFLSRSAGHSLNASTQSEMRLTSGTSISSAQAPECPVRDQIFQ